MGHYGYVDPFEWDEYVDRQEDEDEIEREYRRDNGCNCTNCNCHPLASTCEECFGIHYL